MLFGLVLLGAGAVSCASEQNGASTGFSAAFDLQSWAEEQRKRVRERGVAIENHIVFETHQNRKTLSGEQAREDYLELLDYLEAYNLHRPEVADRYRYTEEAVVTRRDTLYARRYLLKEGQKGRIAEAHFYYSDTTPGKTPAFLYGIQSEDNYLYRLRRRTLVHLGEEGNMQAAEIAGFQRILWFDADSFRMAFAMRHPKTR
jgi:hypothetical protein